jgi:pimeloyl-ACP methyl ester carboxylesterase
MKILPTLLIEALLIATAALVTTPAWALDGIVPDITGPSDIVTRRTTLINQLWGTSTLPTTLPTVTIGISNPFPSYNVARVDQYVAPMSNGQSNTSNLYNANSSNNGRVVILNPGHQGTCDWTAMASGYRMQPVLQALLAAGYSVFAMNMPACGDETSHVALFTSYGNTAMGYFFEPAVQAMNYWDANATFSRYDFVGLSGGGWTAPNLAALDTRIKISVGVAGSWPGISLTGINCSEYCGDNGVFNGSEQDWLNYYDVAGGYLDLYVMAAYGPNRRHFQILNYNDNCCAGNTQYISGGAQAHYGVDYVTFIRNYSVAAKQLEASVVVPMNYDVTIDYIANQHQISTNAQQIILSMLASVGPGTAGGGRRLLHMW